MSLQNMVAGYMGSGIYEGVSQENLQKYNVVNGAITMAMESAIMFDEAFMEGFYKLNEMEVEVAMEGYSSIMESGKFEAFKERIKNAGKKIAGMFRTMGTAIHSFFANIAGKIKEKMLASDKFFNSLPTHVKVIKYKGPKFTHLEEIKDILNDCSPSSVLGSTDGYSKIISGKLKEGSDFSVEKFKEEGEKYFNKLQMEFGVPEAQIGEGNMSMHIAAYFRDNHMAGEDDSLNTKEQEVSISYVNKVVKAGTKISSDIANVGKNMKKEYDDYAKKCEEASKEEGIASEFSSAWLALASMARKSQSVASTVVSAWNSAYTQAIGLWESGARQYSARVQMSVRKNDGGYRK